MTESTPPSPHEELELLRSVVRQLDKPLMITRTSLHARGRGIAFVNPAFQRMIGRPETELVDASPEILMGPDRSVFDRMYVEVLAGRAFEGQVPLSRGDGTIFTNEFGVYPLADASGRVTHLVSIHTDVSEKRGAEQRQAELEESVRRTEKMAALGAIAAGVAHQVRNRLFGITATFDAFDARFGAGAGFGAFLSVIREDLNRLTVLMRDLLEYGSAPTLAIAPGSLVRTISDAVSHAGARAADAGVTIRATPPEVASLPMDRAYIGQVLSKLLEHAISRSPRGAEVNVSVESVVGIVVIRVRDRGARVREEDLPRLFEPFVVERTAGLGLAIAHRIVEGHGGTLAARNVDDGMEIVMTLPTSAPEPRS